MKKLILVISILGALGSLKASEYFTNQEYLKNYTEEYSNELTEDEIFQLSIDCQYMSEDEQPLCNI